MRKIFMSKSFVKRGAPLCILAAILASNAFAAPDVNTSRDGLFRYITEELIDKEEVLGPRLAIRHYGGMNPIIGFTKETSKNPFLEVLNEVTYSDMSYSLEGVNNPLSSSGVISRADLVSGHLAPVLTKVSHKEVKIRVPITRIGNPQTQSTQVNYPLDISYFKKRNEYYFTFYDAAIKSMNLFSNEIVYHVPEDLSITGMFNNSDNANLVKGESQRLYFATNNKAGPLRKNYMIIPITDGFTRTSHKTTQEKLALKFLYIPLPEEGFNQFDRANEATYSGTREYIAIQELKEKISNHLLNDDKNARHIVDRVNTINQERFNISAGGIYKEDTYLNDSAEELRNLKKQLYKLEAPIVYTKEVRREGIRVVDNHIEYLQSNGKGSPRVMKKYPLDTDPLKIKEALLEDGFITNSEWSSLFSKTRKNLTVALEKLSKYKKYKTVENLIDDGQKGSFKNAARFFKYIKHSMSTTSTGSSSNCGLNLNKIASKHSKDI